MSAAAYAAVAGGSAIVGAAGSIKAGNAAKKIADYNAAISDRNAKVFEQQAEMRMTAQDRDNIRFEESAAQFLDTVGVAYRKNNVVANTGTALTVQLESAANADEDIAYKTYNAKVDAQAFREQATNATLQGNVTRMEGAAKKQASRIQAFQSLLGGGEKAAYASMMA